MHRIAAALLALTIPMLANCTFLSDATIGGDGVEKVTTVILVRHCERFAETLEAPDPVLTDEGVTRSNAMKTTLESAGINVIYTTDLTRNRQSVVPLATALGITPILVNPARYVDVTTAGQQLKDEILAQHRGKTILFCGNRGSTLGTPGILERLYRELGGTGKAPERYADLYTIIIPAAGDTQFILGEYGGKSSLDP